MDKPLSLLVWERYLLGCGYGLHGGLTARSVSHEKRSPFQGSGRATQAHRVSRSEGGIGTRQSEFQEERQWERTSPIEIPLLSRLVGDILPQQFGPTTPSFQLPTTDSHIRFEAPERPQPVRAPVR